MDEHHVHCMSCVNHRCTTRPKPGISCSLVNCPLVCGAAFHSCKTTEHHLLCPLERVPCLNSGSGCPATLVRNRMSAHLDVCPAGVVCCTMEWNRWPVSCLDYTSYESLSRGVEEVEQLDMALALQDQRTLLESLKVVAMAPTAEREPPGDGATDPSSPPVAAPAASESPSASSSVQPEPPPGWAREKIANGINGLNEEQYSKLYEATVETARSLAAALDVFSGASFSDAGAECKKKVAAVRECREEEEEEEELHNGLEASAPAAAGVLDVKGMDEQSVCRGCLSGKVAHIGAGLQILDTEKKLSGISSGGAASLEPACPGERQADGDAVIAREASARQPPPAPLAPPLHVNQGVAQRAGHVVLEDRGLVLLEDRGPERKFHSYQLLRGPGQFSLTNGRRAWRRSRVRPPTEDKAVDTSDLEQEEDPMGLGEIDLITAALFFCLEESRECRRISDTVYVDGYHVDFGTQTFTFPAAILVTNTRVGDMASASACDHAAPQLSYPSPFRTLRLGLVLEALELEEVPHNRYLPPTRYQHMFPFVCAQSFRRDQFSSHFTNVHGDIHAGLNGWMEHRCPLAYYGCTFSQRRFHPSARGAKVVHDRHLRSFGVQLCPGVRPLSACQPDQLSMLPIEILWHVAGFLDSFSLCQLAMVSRSMREVCASLLQARGIVELQWERTQHPLCVQSFLGTVSWQVKCKVWRFSTAFSPVSSWCFADLPSMSNHLKKCRFNAVERRTEPVPLPAMCTVRDGHSLRGVLRHIAPDLTPA